MSDYDDLLESLRPLVQGLRALSQRAVREYQPIVNDIVRSDSRDVRHIEQTLDGLLGFCGYDPALALYKKLCRHYWRIDPAATASYIYAYRDMWDSEEVEKDKPTQKKPS